ncbi:MAG TPA: coiled coil domain-containing protein [candidate division Zixibacteria bacterium]|nr:coiled coil domain-containing protein [candidate division Zixibacteria bacterium]
MSDKELYQQKKQAQLDEWQAKLDEKKAQASGASADAQLKLKEQVKVLEGKIEEGKAKLAELSDAGDDAWESMKDGIESAWETIKSAFKG